AIIHQRPSAYSFLPELEVADVRQISIETAQSHLDCKVFAALSSKTIMLGVLDLADMTVETPAIVADRIRRALPYVDASKIVVAPDCGLKYLPRDVAFGKMRAMVEGALVVRSELSLMRGGAPKLLERPPWSALTTMHANFALGGDLARRYPAT